MIANFWGDYHLVIFECHKCYERGMVRIFCGKKTIFLHIGMNETGTTSLQNTLYANRQILLENNLLYSETGLTNPETCHYKFSTWFGFRDINAGIMPKSDLSQELAELNAEIERSECSNIIISSECFVLPGNFEALESFLSQYQVRIIVYLRRHDDWWVSLYSQALKMVSNPPWPAGLTGYLDFNQQNCPRIGDYRALLDKWAEVFGGENLIVRPFEQEQNQPNLITDFLTAIGFSNLPAKIRHPEKLANLSLSYNATELLEIASKIKVTEKQCDKIKQFACAMKSSPSNQHWLSPEQRMRLIDKYQADYRYIAETYMNRAEGQLFHSATIEPDPDWRPPTQMGTVQAVNQILEILELAS